MADTYKNFKELQENEVLNEDYKIDFHYEDVKYQDIIILSIHSGGIEGTTGNIASEIAKDTFCHYDFQGIKLGGSEGGNDVLHISSNRYDESYLEFLLPKMKFALSVHGAKDKESLTYVCGLDQVAIEMITKALVSAGFNATSDVPSRLNGRNLNNIVNRTQSKEGVQLEISQGQRDEFFVDWRKRKGRVVKEDAKSRFELYCEIIRNEIIKYKG
jgi:phage replication-related protein YjqB (UPF0714/DUF867 family)